MPEHPTPDLRSDRLRYYVPHAAPLLGIQERSLIQYVHLGRTTVPTPHRDEMNRPYWYREELPLADEHK